MANPKNDKNFKKLQKKWYSKLAKSGFNDIEWTDHSSGHGQNSSYTKGPVIANGLLNDKDAFQIESIQQHFRLCQNFTTHFSFRSQRDRQIMQWHCDGLSYRQICNEYKRKFGKSIANSYFSRKGPQKITPKAIFLFMQHFVPLAYEWNKTDPNGTWAAENDLIVDEILLKERPPQLADMFESEYAALVKKVQKNSKNRI